MRFKWAFDKVRGRLHNRHGKFRGDVIVFHRYQAAYFAIPKVANSSFKALSVDLLADEIDDQYLNPQWKPYPFRNAEGRSYLSKKRILVSSFSDVEKDYWKFGFVRNPWDRLVSCYSEKISKREANGNLTTSKNHLDGVSRTYLKKYGKDVYSNMPFNQFIDLICKIPDSEADEHFLSQYIFLSDQNGNILTDYIGKLEQLESDFDHIKKKCGFGNKIQMPHLLKSDKGHFHQYYDESSYRKVGARYQKDIQLFNY